MSLIKLLEDPDFATFDNLKRYNGKSLLRQETVSQHTFFVSIFTRLLCEDILKEDDYYLKLILVDFALFHDFTEMFDFDINYEVKYNEINSNELKPILDDYINQMLEKKFNAYFQSDLDNFIKNTIFKKVIIDRELYKIVKIADLLSIYYFLLNERRLGNNTMEKTFNRAKLLIKESSIELRDYLKNRKLKSIELESIIKAMYEE